MKVLITDGGHGQNHGALGAVRSLARAGHTVHVTVSGRFSTAAWSRHSAGSIPVPPVHEEEYAEVVGHLAAAGRYDLVLPASDAALLALDAAGTALVDKQEVAERAADAGLAPARSWSFADGAQAAGSAEALPFPCAVKANTKDAEHGFPVWRADGPADLERLRAVRAPVFLEEWLEGDQQAVCGVVWGGRLRAVVHQRYLRTWPPDCGVSSAAVTTGPDPELEERVVRLLSGYEGIFQCQLLGGRLHDVNPRVYGSIGLAERAGVNLPDVVCRLLGGEDLGQASPLRGRAGVHYRWLEGDLRHAVSRRRAGQARVRDTARQLRPVPGTAHPDFWLTDPTPTAARLAHAVASKRRGGQPR